MVTQYHSHRSGTRHDVLIAPDSHLKQYQKQINWEKNDKSTRHVPIHVIWTVPTRQLHRSSTRHGDFGLLNAHFKHFTLKSMKKKEKSKVPDMYRSVINERSQHVIPTDPVPVMSIWNVLQSLDVPKWKYIFLFPHTNLHTNFFKVWNFRKLVIFRVPESTRQRSKSKKRGRTCSRSIF